MKAPPLSRRIRNGALLLLALALILGMIALPRVFRLGGAIRETLYRNYISIEAAQHMNAALTALQIAERDGTLDKSLASDRKVFMQGIGMELGDITEAGEAQLARDIDQRARRLLTNWPITKPAGFTTNNSRNCAHGLTSWWR